MIPRRRIRPILALVAWGLFAATGPLRAQAAVGGTTLSAGIADSQNQLNQALGAASTSGSDSVTQFASAYRASGGGPTLAFLGFNPFQIIATGAFHQLYWSAIVILLGIMTVIAMQQSLLSRQTLSARHPLAALAQVYFRLLFGALIVADTPLLYGLLMTLNSALSEGVEAMAASSANSLLQTGGMGTLSLAQARMEAIRDAAARRALALFPGDASRDEMVQVGTWYDAMAAAVNAALSAQTLPGQLPRLSADWNDAQTPDDRIESYVGRTVVQNFGPMVADLGALPAASGGLTIEFPAGGSTALPLLSGALAADDAQAAQALALPNVPASEAGFESARQLYAKNVLADTLQYLDTDVLAVVGASPTLANRVKDWFSEKVAQAAAAAGGFMTEWRSAVDWVGRGLGVTLTRMVAFFLVAAVNVMIEIELFLLVLTVPFWLVPATEDAFYGVLRSLFALSAAVPAYQFIMLLVDALMGLLLKYLLFGPLAAGSPGAGQAAAGAAYLGAAAIAIVGSGGEIVALVIFCYLVAYLFLAIYVAVKTPRLVALFLKGAGAAGAFLSTFATGLVAGASSALVTAVAAGGGTAARLLTTGSRAGLGSGARLGTDPVYATAGAAGASPGPAPAGGRPTLGPMVARATTRRTRPETGATERPPAPPSVSPEPHPNAGAVVSFGLRTFAESLRSDSPAEGFKIAMQALDQHRKRQKKEAEERYRATTQASRNGRPARGGTPRAAPDEA